MKQDNTQTPHSHKIGLLPCLAFAVGTMIGGGVFTLSGVAVDEAGPSAIFGYVLAGVIMLMSALTFAAVASRSKPGDSGYAAIGEILRPEWRFLTMWAFYINAVTSMAFVLISFGSYLRQYFVPSVSTTAAALLAVVLLALLNLGPADIVGRTESFLVALKVGILLVLVVYGLIYVSPDDFSPLAPEGGGSLLRVTAMLFTAYIGFNVVTNMAGSVRRPERTVPLAIILSIVICGVVYVGVIVALLASGVQHFGEAGLGRAAEALMGAWGAVLVAFAACVSTLSGANANMLGSSELMIKLAAQGDVAGRWGKLTRHKHPAASVLLAAAIVVVLISRGDLETAVALSNVAAIIAMLIVNVAAYGLARNGWPAPGMRLRGGRVLPVVAFATAAAQLPSLGWADVLLGTAMVFAGLFIYVLRHRPELAADPDPILRAIKDLETPVARVMRRRDKRDLTATP